MIHTKTRKHENKAVLSCFRVLPSQSAMAHCPAMAEGETILQVDAIGPFQLTYVNPKDDPTK